MQTNNRRNIYLNVIQNIFIVIVVIAILILIITSSIVKINGNKFKQNGDKYLINNKNMFVNYTNDNSSSNATVVFFTDIGEPSSAWAHIKNNLEKGSLIENKAYFVSSLSYDRLGYGYSDAPNKNISMQDQLDNISMILKKGAYPTPYILVGNGYGGILAKKFANEHPSKVGGIVLINSLTDDTIKNGEMKFALQKTQNTYSKLNFLSNIGLLYNDNIWSHYTNDAVYTNGLADNDKDFYNHYIKLPKTLNAISGELKILQKYKDDIDSKNFLEDKPVISLVSKYNGLYFIDNSKWLKNQKEIKISSNLDIIDFGPDADYILKFSDKDKIENSIKNIINKIK